MTGMSSLSPSARSCFRLVLQKNNFVSKTWNKQSALLGQVFVRNAGHEKRMVITPSRYDWQRFKDDLHFYVMIGLIPIFAVIGYANIFVGPATLSDIEEGYEPEEWEYYKSPIKRWLVKYIYQPPQKEYEKTLHYLHKRREDRYWNLLDKKAKILMSDRQDYKGWYWINKEKSVAEEQLRAAEFASRMDGTK